MKRYLRRALDLAAVLVGWLQVEVVRRWTSAGDTVVVLDIDNTLAHAWPSFLEPFDSHRARLAGLPVLPNVKAVLHDEPHAAGTTIVYLSHRNAWEWPVTFRWLREHGFSVAPDRLILVPDAAVKVRHLRRLASGRDVVYWDDLSFGHETGTTSFHDDVIARVRALPLTYHGWDEIEALTGGK